METKTIMDRVKTWEDAAEIAGIDPVKSLPFQNPENDHQRAANAFYQTQIITEVLNESWVPNWDDRSEEKWENWFNMRSSGGGFSFYDSFYAVTRTDVGARLVFKTETLADYAGNQFLHIYKTWMTK